MSIQIFASGQNRNYNKRKPNKERVSNILNQNSRATHGKYDLHTHMKQTLEDLKNIKLKTNNNSKEFLKDLKVTIELSPESNYYNINKNDYLNSSSKPLVIETSETMLNNNYNDIITINNDQNMTIVKPTENTDNNKISLMVNVNNKNIDEFKSLYSTGAIPKRDCSNIQESKSMNDKVMNHDVKIKPIIDSKQNENAFKDNVIQSIFHNKDKLLRNDGTLPINIQSLKNTNNIIENSTKKSNVTIFPFLKSHSNKYISNDSNEKKFTGVYFIYSPLKNLLPLKNVDEAMFHNSIKLQSQKMLKSFNIHCYTWPAILRGLNVCIIHNKIKYDKDLIYLPPICEMSLQYPLNENDGPSIIILTSEYNYGNRILNNINELYKELNDKMSVAYLVDTNTTKKISCNILIGTPTSILNGVKENCFHLKYVRHFIIDDVYVLIKNEGMNLLYLTRLIEESHKLSNKKIQTILLTNNWSMSINKYLQLFYDTFFVIMSNYLSAASFGKCLHKIIKVKSNEKKCIVADILYKKYLQNKTVIISDYYEIKELESYLKLKGFNVICLPEVHDEINIYEFYWTKSKPGNYNVLLITDDVLKALKNVLDASILIHYSLPNEWNNFVSRFRVLVNNFEYTNYIGLTKIRCKFYILLDKECNEIYYQFLNNVGK